jgi:hypothetical protein
MSFAGNSITILAAARFMFDEPTWNMVFELRITSADCGGCSERCRGREPFAHAQNNYNIHIETTKGHARLLSAPKRY